jgi:16S rRNA U516 pseudouridylate synthase RsuA-like enzyme
VKRYCAALDHPVVRLRRVRFGPLRLGTLALGKTRRLTADEIAGLESLRGPDGSPILGRIRG